MEPTNKRSILTTAEKFSLTFILKKLLPVEIYMQFVIIL